MSQMGNNLAKRKMKRIVIIIMAIAIMPFVSMGFNNSNAVRPHNLTKEVKSNNDWKSIGTTVISKKVGSNSQVDQTVQVYRNSEGTCAIKDGRYYHEIEENTRYGKFSDCWECGYRYRVLYEGETWYTHSVVKQTYGSY